MNWGSLGRGAGGGMDPAGATSQLEGNTLDGQHGLRDRLLRASRSSHAPKSPRTTAAMASGLPMSSL